MRLRPGLRPNPDPAEGAYLAVLRPWIKKRGSDERRRKTGKEREGMEREVKGREKKGR